VIVNTRLQNAAIVKKEIATLSGGRSHLLGSSRTTQAISLEFERASSRRPLRQ